MSHKQRKGRTEAVGGHTGRQRHPDKNQDCEESIEVIFKLSYIYQLVYFIFLLDNFYAIVFWSYSEKSNIFFIKNFYFILFSMHF
jgi:hypothetical protein